MKQVVFKQGSIQNFLSFGEDTFHFQFSSGITLITGENRDKGGKNGVGKCVDPRTEIDIDIPDAMVSETFKKYLLRDK